VSRSRRLVLLCLAASALLAVPGPARAGEIRVRKDAKDMTVQEKRDFVDAVKQLKRYPSPFGKSGISLYDALVYFHRRAAYPTGSSGAHEGPAFLPWHRAFLLYFENALNNVAHKPITVPYWDWTDPASTRAVFSPDLMGGDGRPSRNYAVSDGPFRRGQWKLKVFDLQNEESPLEPDIDRVVGKATYVQRRMGSLEGYETLPTAAEMESVLAVGSYDARPYDARTRAADSFRCALEGWRRLKGVRTNGHNGVHMWVAGLWENRRKEQLIGTLGDAVSPNDPVFWLVHANVDRLWDRWEQAHGDAFAPRRGARRGHNLMDRLSQFGELDLDDNRPADLLDLERLEVRYAPPGGTPLAAPAPVA